LTSLTTAAAFGAPAEGVDHLADPSRGHLGDQERPAVEVQVGIDRLQDDAGRLVGSVVEGLEVRLELLEDVVLAPRLRRPRGLDERLDGARVAGDFPAVPAHREHARQEGIGIDLLARDQGRDDLVEEAQVDRSGRRSRPS
jgi:hypothetical protein